MTVAFALPFFNLSDEVVVLNDWTVSSNLEDFFPLGSVLADWDYAVDLKVRSSMSIDLAAAASMLAIPQDRLKLEVVLRVGTGRGRLPRIVRRASSISVDASMSQPIELSAILHGSELSGSLRLRVDVLLAVSVEECAVLSPKQVGSRVWSSEFLVELEEDSDSRFPMEVVSFKEVFPYQAYIGAPWFLSWHPGQLGADFNGSVRLYINSDHAELTKRVVDGDNATLQAILGDVMSLMMTAALDADELAEQLRNYEEGTVGAQIADWLELAFPGRHLLEIRNVRRSLPGNFHASVLAAAELGKIA